jgi:hypothetical protein
LIEKNERVRLGQRSEAALFFEGDASHTAQARPLGSPIEGTSEALQQKVFSTLIKSKTENRSKIFDLNQTALLPHFRNLRESDMPMQPKPMAERIGPFLPNDRVNIKSFLFV